MTKRAKTSTERRAAAIERRYQLIPTPIKAAMGDRDALAVIKQQLAKPVEFAVVAIDLSLAPYTICCPVCRAFACAPCRSEPRAMPRLGHNPPPPGFVFEKPHPERWVHWDSNPHMRVKVKKDPTASVAPAPQLSAPKRSPTVVQTACSHVFRDTKHCLKCGWAS